MRFWVAAALLIASLTVLGWGIAPAPHESHVLLLSPKDMALPASIPPSPAPANPSATPKPGSTEASATPLSAVNENRRLTLEFPKSVRKGDSEIASLVLGLDTTGAAVPATAGWAGYRGGASAPIVDVYETHNVIARAELDLAGMDVRPSEAVSEPLLPGESAIFRWRLHSTDAGRYEGTGWLFLDFIDKSTHAQSRVALSAQTVTIEATSLLGLSGNSARLVGGLGLIFASLAGFPYADDLLKWLRARASAVP